MGPRIRRLLWCEHRVLNTALAPATCRQRLEEACRVLPPSGGLWRSGFRRPVLGSASLDRFFIMDGIFGVPFGPAAWGRFRPGDGGTRIEVCLGANPYGKGAVAWLVVIAVIAVVMRIRGGPPIAAGGTGGDGILWLFLGVVAWVIVGGAAMAIIGRDGDKLLAVLVETLDARSVQEGDKS